MNKSGDVIPSLDIENVEGYYRYSFLVAIKFMRKLECETADIVCKYLLHYELTRIDQADSFFNTADALYEMDSVIGKQKDDAANQFNRRVYRIAFMSMGINLFHHGAFIKSQHSITLAKLIEIKRSIVNELTIAIFKEAHGRDCSISMIEFIRYWIPVYMRLRLLEMGYLHRLNINSPELVFNFK